MRWLSPRSSHNPADNISSPGASCHKTIDNKVI
jgi:hypothetical protein